MFISSYSQQGIKKKETVLFVSWDRQHSPHPIQNSTGEFQPISMRLTAMAPSDNTRKEE